MKITSVYLAVASTMIFVTGPAVAQGIDQREDHQQQRIERSRRSGL